ncbi:hypothetical protein U1Q18_002653, partial [Sarracenia purpurea var. burkii]
YNFRQTNHGATLFMREVILDVVVVSLAVCIAVLKDRMPKTAKIGPMMTHSMIGPLGENCFEKVRLFEDGLKKMGHAVFSIF